MQYGPPQILTCPHCGTKKQILSILSGNTFGAVFWSDNRCYAPMMDHVSYVQRCPGCGMYYILSRQEPVFADGDTCHHRGELSYSQMKEAFAQLSGESFLDNMEEAQVRMLLHHTYNDYHYRHHPDYSLEDDFLLAYKYYAEVYHRNNLPPVPIAAADHDLFVENARWLIDNFIYDDVLKAEFCREIGDMERATALLDSAKIEDDFVRDLVAEIRKRIAAGDCAVFKFEE